MQALLWARHGDAAHAEQVFAKGGDKDPVSLMGRGMLAARQNRVKDAEGFFRAALKLAPNDALILREAGIFEYSKGGDIDRARQYLDKALRLYPGDYYGLFFQARILDDTGDRAGAQQRYREVLRRVPEDSEVHTYYGRSLGAVGRLSDGYLHLAYASLYANDQRKADNWLEKAKKAARTPEEKKSISDYEKKAAERAKIMKEAR